MAARVVHKGKEVLLPLLGMRVSEIHFGRGPVVLVFGERDDTELTIADAITLSRGTAERVLRGSGSGASFNIAELGPILEVYGVTVVEAVAFKDGTLRLGFQTKLVLSVVSTTGYEAWHFRSPELRLHGASGYLI